MSKNPNKTRGRQCNPLVMDDDVRESLRTARRERGIMISHAGNAAIRLGLPLVLENLHTLLTPGDVLAAAKEYVAAKPK